MTTLPTADRIRDIILSRLLGSPGLAGADTARGGFFWQVANAFARQGRNLLVRADAMRAQGNPATATGDPLTEWADTVLGEGAAAATAWVGTIEIRCANSTQTVPSGQVGTHEDGTGYRTTAAINPTDWILSGTYYYARPAGTSTTLGSVANKAASTPITLASPPAGVQSTAYIQTTTTEAKDAETEDEMQQRIRQHLSEMPGGGSGANYRAWCQEVADVYDACIYRRWNGAAAAGDLTARCIILGPPGNRILTGTEVTATQTHLADRTPLFFDVTVALPQPTAKLVALTVRPAPGYEADWSFASFATTVTGIDIPARKINLFDNPVGTIVAGNRVVIHCADEKSYQMVVQSVGANWIIVTEAWTSDPQVGKYVRPGGPLWQPIRSAIEGVFDALGTSASSTMPSKPRWPLPSRELPSTLYLGDLYEGVEGVTGVVSCTIGTPATDQANTAAETVAPTLIRLIGGAGGEADLTIAWDVAS